MKRREWTLLVAALALIAASALVLVVAKGRQRLGKPGLKCTPIEGSIRVNINLPESAQGFHGRPVPLSDTVVEMLPSDTSIAQMLYTNAAGQEVFCCAVMMGTDRTSIHKPQFCLTGQGYRIDEKRSELTTIRVYRPSPVDLPVMKLVATKETTIDGKPVQVGCVFVYWLVSGDELMVNQRQMGLRISRHILRTGELSRWSYVFYMANCVPGREDAAFTHISRVINATLPDFQLTWPPGTTREAR
jgi:hypothetical protein